MALSWSLDKIGPICRTAMDCAIVLSVLSGPDPLDPATTGVGFEYHPVSSLKDLKVGYLKSAFDKSTRNRKQDSLALQAFRDLGAVLVPLEMPESISFSINSALFKSTITALPCPP